MDYQSNQLVSPKGLSSAIETGQLFCNMSKRSYVLLLTETSVVSIIAITAIKLLQTNMYSGAQWFISPCILVAAGLIPTLIKKSKFSEIGLSFVRIKYSLTILSRYILLVLPAMFCGLWLLKYYGLSLPLRPVLSQGQGWFSWVFYQFMYIAVAEELFFRGFLQSNVLRLTGFAAVKRKNLKMSMAIIISAGCFAIAHVVVQGRMISALTFGPGLIFGWLFMRTRSLVAPILFHGLVNTSYFVMAELLAV